MSLRPFVSGRRRRRGELVPTLFMILAVLALCAGAYGLKQTGLLDGGTGSAKAAGTTVTRSATGGTAGSTGGAKVGTGPGQPSTDEVTSAEDLERSYNLLGEESKHLRSVIEKRGSRGGGADAAHMQWPVEGDLVVSSEFGPRMHPVLGREIKHEGVDIAVPLATSVIAAAGGKVIYVSDLEVHGTTLVVDHGNGLATVYCHLSRTLVKEGAKVQRGQALAKSGMTGLATGPHLHFEVRINGEPSDPREFLPELPPQVSWLDALRLVAV